MVNHMRHTRSQSAQRRSHHAIKAKNLTLCPECKMPKMSHMVCPHCGKYRGRVVIDMSKVSAKKEAKNRAAVASGAKA